MKKINPSPVMLPCPFCGGKPNLIDNGANWFKGIECKKCGVNAYFFYPSGPHKGTNIGWNDLDLNAVVKAWNKRIKT